MIDDKLIVHAFTRQHTNTDDDSVVESYSLLYYELSKLRRISPIDTILITRHIFELRALLEIIDIGFRFSRFAFISFVFRFMPEAVVVLGIYYHIMPFILLIS